MLAKANSWGFYAAKVFCLVGCGNAQRAFVDYPFGYYQSVCDGAAGSSSSNNLGFVAKALAISSFLCCP